MCPCFSFSDHANSSWADIEHFSNFPLRNFLFSDKALYFTYGFIGQMSGGVVLAFLRMKLYGITVLDVLRRSDPLKIAGAVVRFVAINMVDLKASFALSDERLGNDDVRLSSLSPRVLLKNEYLVATHVIWFQILSYIHLVVSNGCNAPVIAYFVAILKSANRFPYSHGDYSTGINH